MAIISTTRLTVALKTKWRKKTPKTLEDAAGVVGFNIWRIAHETYKHMEREAFRFTSDAQVSTVLTELIAFLVQVTDRLVYGRMSEADRAVFINALAKHLARTMETNQRDLLGPGDYQARFIEALNLRFRDYAECDFVDGAPSYPFLRRFGEVVFDAMKDTDNKWVVEHMMDIAAVDMLKYLKKLIAEVLEFQV